MKNKITIIIPTIQKNTDILNALVKECTEDKLIQEIIIIDNLCKGYSFDSSKIRVIQPKKNLYVNPAWNLGVKETKTEYFALLNDDILIPKNLIYQVVNFMEDNPNIGVIGMAEESVIKIGFSEKTQYPENTTIDFEKINHQRLKYWGCAIFGKKNTYKKIPEKMKVWCGDDYYVFANLKKKNPCYRITNGNVLHLGSLTSSSKSLYDIKRADLIYYLKLDPKHIKLMSKKLIKNYKLDKIDFTPWYKKIFSVKNECYKNKKHKIITLLGIKIKFQVI